MEDRAVVGGTSFRQEGRIYCTSDGTLKGEDVVSEYDY
jgi:hypothetical protein